MRSPTFFNRIGHEQTSCGWHGMSAPGDKDDGTPANVGTNREAADVLILRLAQGAPNETAASNRAVDRFAIS